MNGDLAKEDLKKVAKEQDAKSNGVIIGSHFPRKDDLYDEGEWRGSGVVG